jgi:hypothetical protein
MSGNRTSSRSLRLVRRGRALRAMPLTEAGYLAGALNAPMSI